MPEQELTVPEVAALYWRMLETQNTAGLDWELYQRIPNELKPLCPCRRVVRRDRRADAELLSAYRVYSESAAISALEKLGFNLFSELAEKGYHGAYKKFCSDLRLYARAARAFAYYA